MVSKRSYAAPAGRDLEIAPTLDAGISIALAIHSFDGRDLEIAPTVGALVATLEIAGISIALAIHSFDPTVDALAATWRLRGSLSHSLSTRLILQYTNYRRYASCEIRLWVLRTG